MLVDDEEEFADAFAERLRLRGFTPHVANNGDQALRMFGECGARIIVLDIKMPGMDGLEVLRRIKKRDPEAQVIILSGHGAEKDELHARGLGAFEYLRKPADIGTVLEALKRAEKKLQESS